jgi:hypothetical protein
LVDKETPIAELFGKAEANELEQQMLQAIDTQQRINIFKAFLLKKLNEKTTISNIVKSTVDALLKTDGTTPINVILKENISKRRQLERHSNKFKRKRYEKLHFNV